MRDGVVWHVDGAVRQTFHKLWVVPRQTRAESVIPCHSPLIHPAQSMLDGVFCFGCECIEILPVFSFHMIKNFLSPSRIRVAVGQEPLVQMRGHTFIARPWNDETVGFAIDDGITGVEEGLANKRFRFLYWLAGELSVDHCAVVEAFLVRNLFCLSERLCVFRWIDLHFLYEGRGRQVAVRWGRDDRERVWVDDPLGLDSVKFGLFRQVNSHCVIVGTIARHAGYNTCTLTLFDRIHRDDVDFNLPTQRRVDKASDDIRPFQLSHLCEGAPFWEDTLKGHVSCCARCDEKEFGFRYRENAVGDLGRYKKEVLSVHGFGSESCRDHVDSSIWRKNASQLLFGFVWPLLDQTFHRGVFLHKNSLSWLSIMIQTGLPIFRRIDGIAFTELDFVELFQAAHLPSDKGIVVWVGICGNKWASPVNCAAKFGQMLLPKLREVTEPVMCVSKEVYLLERDTNREHHLELILCFHPSLQSGFSFLGVWEFGYVCFGLFRHWRWECSVRDRIDDIILGTAWEIFAEHFNLPNKFIGTSFNRHAGTVIALRIQDAFPLSSRYSCGEFNLGYGEGVP